MKYLIYIILFLFFLCFSCTEKENNYEWKDLSFKNDIHLTSICMLDDEVGFVGGRVKFKTEEIIRMRSIPAPYCCDTLVFSPDNEYFYNEYIFKDPHTIEPLLYKQIMVVSVGRQSKHLLKPELKIWFSLMKVMDM